MQTFAVIFALCGLFVHGEPPSVLMFVLDLYSWLGPRVLARLYLWQPVLLHLRNHLLPARLLTAQSRLIKPSSHSTQRRRYGTYLKGLSGGLG